MVEEKDVLVASDLDEVASVSPSARDIPDLQPEITWLGLGSQLGVWKVRKSRCCWLESRYWEPKVSKLQTGDGAEADKRLGTPGADQNPITSVINLLIGSLIALRMEY